MESVQAGRGRIPGIVSMTLAGVAVVSALMTAVTIPYAVLIAILAMVIGIVAVILGGRGSEYGIVGIAVGLIAMLALLLDITL